MKDIVCFSFWWKVTWTYFWDFCCWYKSNLLWDIQICIHKHKTIKPVEILTVPAIEARFSRSGPAVNTWAMCFQTPRSLGWETPWCWGRKKLNPRDGQDERRSSEQLCSGPCRCHTRDWNVLCFEFKHRTVCVIALQCRTLHFSLSRSPSFRNTVQHRLTQTCDFTCDGGEVEQADWSLQRWRSQCAAWSINTRCFSIPKKKQSTTSL